MTNSFASNINYIADLDTKYGYSASLTKVNLPMVDRDYTITLSLKSYSKVTQQEKSVNVVAAGVNVGNYTTKIVTLVSDALAEGFTLVDASVVTDLYADIKFTITSVSDSDILHSPTMVLVSEDVQYTVNGSVLEPIRVLPYLATMPIDIVENTIKVGQDIEAVNSVSEHLVAIDSAAANMIDIQNAEENAASALQSKNEAEVSAGIAVEVENKLHTLTVETGVPGSVVEYDGELNKLAVPRGAPGANGVDGMTPVIEFTYDSVSGNLQYEITGYIESTSVSTEEW